MEQDTKTTDAICTVTKAFAQPHPADAEVEAFVTLFTPIVERPVSKILSPCGGSDIEQAVVDVFFRLWQKRGALPQNETVVFYILRVAHSVAVDAYRKHKKRIFAVELLPDDTAFEAAPADETQSEPYRHLEVQELLDILPEETRSIFLAYYYEGCSAQEIARHHSIKVPTVYTRLRRAKTQMQKYAKTHEVT